jgi:GTP-binding protein
MALIDEIKFYAEAGKCGDGVIRWRQEKFVPKGGPAGGDGGRGGDFYAVAVRDISILTKYKAKKSFKAEDGEAGGNKSLHGKNGEDFILELPIGSIISNIDTGEKWQLLEEGKKVLLLRGGYGGYGNEHFKSSINTTPKKANEGALGESGNFTVELMLFADIGLVGYPNAGKSSMLNMITKANAKVGDYAFTTLDPNLGDFYGYIIADIPGIIEGASEGKGLGLKFLRHIKRTKMLFHCLSLESTSLITDYKTIRKELKAYSEELAAKEGIYAAEAEVNAEMTSLTFKLLWQKKLEAAKIYARNVLQIITNEYFLFNLGRLLNSPAAWGVIWILALLLFTLPGLIVHARVSMSPVVR